MADAKTSLGRGGGAAAAAGTTMGAVDGYDGGGNDGDVLADGNLLAREEDGKDSANVGATGGDDGEAAAAAGATMGAGDGNDGGGNDGYVLVDGDQLSQ